MRAWIWILLIVLVLLQYRLWVGDGSLAEVWQLHHKVDEQKAENARLEERNQTLDAEVKDLKQGQAAVEERAREELGMIRKGETFYQIIEKDRSVDR